MHRLFPGSQPRPLQVFGAADVLTYIWSYRGAASRIMTWQFEHAIVQHRHAERYKANICLT
jgi:hypothetical protein